MWWRCDVVREGHESDELGAAMLVGGEEVENLGLEGRWGGLVGGGHGFGLGVDALEGGLLR